MNSPRFFTCQLKCFLLNEMFSQTYADTMNNGEESEDNQKYQWEDELMVREVVEVKTITDEMYILHGNTPNNGAFSFPIPNMHIIQMTLENGSKVEFAISTILMSTFVQEQHTERIEMKLEIKDNEPFINPIAGIYIAHRDIPVELRNA